MSEANKESLAQPKVIDGIEFYVSTDGKESGMSISGLAKFVGIDRKAVSNLVAKIENGSGSTEAEKERSNEASGIDELVKAYQDVHFDLGAKRAKIIPATICESIIHYYAYTSTAISSEVKEQAQLAHRKFAKYGLHKFILQATGFIERNDVDELKNLMYQVLGEMKELKQHSLELKAIRQSTVRMPGYDELLTDLSSQEYQNNLLAPAEDGSLSVEGWLHSKGITLSKSKFLSLSKSVAANYKAATRKDPNKKHFKLDDGATKYNVFVYQPEYFPILQMCLEDITRRTGLKPRSSRTAFY
jgi:hypothetical protein